MNGASLLPMMSRRLRFSITMVNTVPCHIGDGTRLRSAIAVHASAVVVLAAVPVAPDVQPAAARTRELDQRVPHSTMAGALHGMAAIDCSHADRARTGARDDGGTLWSTAQ